MERRFDVTALGECLLDVIVTSGVDDANVKMEGNAGGAPVNVLAALSKLGRSTAYLGKLSHDAFGSFLKNVILQNNIDTSGVAFTDDPTTLAIVALDKNGDRNFSFYREDTADVNYRSDEIDRDVIRSSRIFHFGSVSMTSEPSRTATLEAAREAKRSGVRVSFDPNLRPTLWNDVEDAREFILEGMKLADYLKLSEEELVYVTGSSDYLDAGKKLIGEYGIALLTVTLGPKGCICITEDQDCYEPTYDVHTIDTTGSGDAFWGAFLSKIIEFDCNVEGIDREGLSDIAKFANAAGSLCSTKHGAIGAMVDRESIEKCMAEVPRLIIKD